MKPVLIARGIRPLRNGKRSAKDYPYWDELVALLNKEGYEIREVREMPLPELEPFLKDSLTVICADSFCQHFCWYIDKPAIVLWGVGDPLIFGHKENTNLLKSRNNLREDQFNFWDDVKYNPDVFVGPEVVLAEVKKLKGD